MPGRDYLRAHALFQESLADSAYPSLTRKRQRDDTGTLLRPPPSILAPQTIRDEKTYEPTSRLLPPTPPDAHQDVDPSFGLAQGPQLSDRSSSTRPSTPFGLASSITPDTQLTPPSLGSRADSKPPHAVTYRSSHGESFRTAQEELGSLSSQESSPCLPMQGTDVFDSTVPGLFFPARDESRRSANPTMPSSSQLGNSISPHVPNESRSNALAPPLALRPRSRSETVRPNELTFLDDRRESEDVQWPSEESPRSWYDATDMDEDHAAPRTPEPNPTAQGKEADYLHMTPPKRLPSNPQPSAVIEAEIRDSPNATPKTERRLRHVHKTDALRHVSNESSIAANDADRKPPLVFRSEPEHVRDDDIRAKTRSSLAKSLPFDFGTAPSAWSRPNSLALTRGAGSDLFDPQTRMVSTSFAARLEPFQKPASHVPDQLREVLGASLPKRASLPAEFEHLGSRSGFHRFFQSNDSHPGLSTERQSETLSTRHTLTRASPFSEASEVHVVGDAQAISIFPHNNNSLLVVHQQQSECRSKGVTGNAKLKETKNIPLTYSRSLPGPRHASVDHNTLKDTMLETEGEARSLHHRPQLIRHESLVRRAMRNFSAPNHRMLRRSTAKSSGNVSDERRHRGATSVSVRKKMHSLWHPRGFWDDFSEDGDVSGGHDIIDASEMRPQYSSSFRRAVGGQAGSSAPRSVRARSSSYPSSMQGGALDAAAANSEAPPAISKTALQRLASLRMSVRRMGLNHARGRSNSQRRRLTAGFKEKIQERTHRREERLRQQERERERIRVSIGPRHSVHGPDLDDEGT